MIVLLFALVIQGPIYELNGKIIDQPTYYFLKDDCLLNPNREILNLSSFKNKFYGDINFKIDYGNLKFISKFRPTVLSNKEQKGKNIIDDLYLDMGFKDRYFIYLGKKNIRDGVGLGANPTDFLGEEKEVDMAKREEERRIEREGTYLIGVDRYFKNMTLNAIFAPFIKDLQEERDRCVLKVSVLMETINTDVSFHYFNSYIEGAGINISTTIGESLVLYTESAIRWGSNKKIIRLKKEGEPNLYEIYSANTQKYPHLVGGGHYTFKNGTNIILEYIYNGDGYNHKEWDELLNFITYSYNEYKKGFLKDMMRGNLLQANSMMKFREIRKNYFLVRLSNTEMYKKRDGSLVIFFNLDDKSFLVFPSLNYKIKKNTSIELSGIIFRGDNESEFGMIPWRSEVGIIWRYFFE